ncbi:ParB N-terminal domain-containing protein [Pelagibius sp. Alg239-R121]|uniref:ParB N-terminal domain-containing protein n=1 Tax=Pelagibius sp. Alg239-R121 TaxID=2993448 RepID=UPI0024A6BA09|nr:ParB N-terminal domain-containing protein [Pelagibius sp. Alg239-R121]
MKTHQIPIAGIYVPAKLKNDLDEGKIAERAESLLEEGEQSPIQVRRDDKKGFVLVKGLNRLEASRALGETEIECLIVAARQH